MASLRTSPTNPPKFLPTPRSVLSNLGWDTVDEPRPETDPSSTGTFWELKKQGEENLDITKDCMYRVQKFVVGGDEAESPGGQSIVIFLGPSWVRGEASCRMGGRTQCNMQ